MILFYIFILGACIGSFLNVCIYRLPRELSLIRPRSFCPSCSKPITWHDNIPLLSYFLLQGRCRFCNRKISFRYIFVELLTAILTVLIWSQGHAASLETHFIVLKLILTYALIVVSMVDLEFYIIPNEITYVGLVLGLLFAAVFPLRMGTEHSGKALLFSVLGALVGGGSLWLIGWIAKVFMKKEAMGFGDVKLMGMAGAWLGWEGALGSIMIASIAGAVVGMAFIFNKKLYLESRIAFGPFLSIGIFIFVMWGDMILAWYGKLLYNVHG